MQNGLRPALNKAGAFAIAVLLLVVFVFFSLRGTGRPVSIRWFVHIFGGHAHALFYPMPAITLILERLPATLELLASACILACAAAFAITLLLTRSPAPLRAIVENGGLLLRCIPFVWLATVVALLVTRPGYFDEHMHNQAIRLFYPAACLALFQTPYLVGARSISAFYRAFVKALPDILGAAVITEAAFAWPGDGGLFSQALSLDSPSVAVALVIAASFAVLILRIPASDV